MGCAIASFSGNLALSAVCLVPHSTALSSKSLEHLLVLSVVTNEAQHRVVLLMRCSCFHELSRARFLTHMCALADLYLLTDSQDGGPISSCCTAYRYEDQHFGCANQEFLNCFAASPQEYMDAVMTQAVQHPACIALLNLQSCFRDLSLDKLIEAVEAEPETLDGACQTELHPIAKHMDYNYEWNEWGHRRKALNMVNLRQKRTHGSQTILSHFRRENATQVCYRAIKVSDIVTPIIAVCL